MARRRLPTWLAVVGATAQFLASATSLTLGLIVPPTPYLVLVVLATALFVVAVRLARRRRWLVLAFPPATLGMYAVAATIGEAWFGWTA